MHKTFIPLFIISLVGVLLTSSQQHTEGLLQWIGFAFGSFPLLVYYIILLKKRGLSPAEVDSVYYFGFLVTVCTLVSTAISIGLTQSAIELRWVVFQFGLGLVATGFALFARLHLLSRSMGTADTDIVDANEKLARSVEKVAGSFDKAGYQVAAFVERTEKRLAQSEADFEERLNQAYVHFNELLARSAAQSLERTTNVVQEATARFSEAISLVMEEVGRVQFEAEAISFEKAAKSLSNFAEEMEASITSISGNVADAAQSSAGAISELTSASRKAMRLATDISSRLESLKRLENLVGMIESTTNALNSVVATSSDLDSSLSSLLERVESTDKVIFNEIIEPLSKGGVSSALRATESATASVLTIQGGYASLANSISALELSIRNASLTMSESTMPSAISSLATEADALKVMLRKVRAQLETAAAPGAVSFVGNQHNHTHSGPLQHQTAQTSPPSVAQVATHNDGNAS